MATAQDIITAALIHLGSYSVGQPVDLDKLDLGLDGLNNLIHSWSTERLNIYAIDRNVYALTAAQSYTIGPGAAFAAPNRPVSIRSARILAGNQCFSLKLITAEEWSAINEHFSARVPLKLYNDCAYPRSTLYFWPTPKGSASVELFTWEQLVEYAGLDSAFDLPPGYRLAIELNLALQLAPSYGRPVSQELLAAATQSKSAIRALNQPPAPGLAEEGQARAQVAQSSAPPESLEGKL